ncbi:hypothetical protein Pan44_37530 [Caulifigura coniformis]|uniref:Helix-turn-helix domain-containing protein n=1 Tax=Caulifigura coniformis TaxID=2527983 RepID=A0A517SHX3_9PLAN|nr:hypothetical protein Pan44_37530 [Caulifigura coniformis]
MEALLTREEAIKVLRVSASKLDKDRAAGRIGCVKLGDRVLFEPAEIRRYVDAHRVKGTC